MTPRRSWRRLLVCAARRRCPQCGVGKLFDKFYTLNKRCPHCGRDFRDAEGSTWFFMYFSSAGIVGVFFLVLFFFPPESTATGWLTFVPVAGVVMILTLPHRKALAIAMDYFLDPSVETSEGKSGRE